MSQKIAISARKIISISLNSIFVFNKEIRIKEKKEKWKKRKRGKKRKMCHEKLFQFLQEKNM